MPRSCREARTALAAGVNAGTFIFGSDTYAVVDADASGTYSASKDLLVDIKGTTSLARADFTT